MSEVLSVASQIVATATGTEKEYYQGVLDGQTVSHHTTEMMERDVQGRGPDKIPITPQTITAWVDNSGSIWDVPLFTGPNASSLSSDVFSEASRMVHTAAWTPLREFYEQILEGQTESHHLSTVTTEAIFGVAYRDLRETGAGSVPESTPRLIQSAIKRDEVKYITTAAISLKTALPSSILPRGAAPPTTGLITQKSDDESTPYTTETYTRVVDVVTYPTSDPLLTGVRTYTNWVYPSSVTGIERKFWNPRRRDVQQTDNFQHTREAGESVPNSDPSIKPHVSAAGLHGGGERPRSVGVREAVDNHKRRGVQWVKRQSVPAQVTQLKQSNRLWQLYSSVLGKRDETSVVMAVAEEEVVVYENPAHQPITTMTSMVDDGGADGTTAAAAAAPCSTATGLSAPTPNPPSTA